MIREVILSTGEASNSKIKLSAIQSIHRKIRLTEKTLQTYRTCVVRWNASLGNYDVSFNNSIIMPVESPDHVDFNIPLSSREGNPAATTFRINPRATQEIIEAENMDIAEAIAETGLLLTQDWYHLGKLHRLAGPATISILHDSYHWVDGRRLTDWRFVHKNEVTREFILDQIRTNRNQTDVIVQIGQALDLIDEKTAEAILTANVLT